MIKPVFIICLLALLTACSNENETVFGTKRIAEDASRLTLNNVEHRLDQQVSKLIEQYGLTGSPAGNNIPDIQSAKAQLGKKLFFSRALSGDLNVACASCHHPLLGGGDNLSLPIGVSTRDDEMLGTGRRHKSFASPSIARNAPTTFNIAFWQTTLFHDGRLQKLANGDITTPEVTYPEPDPTAGADLVQAQARFPITANNEMRGDSFHSSEDARAYRQQVAARLGGYAKKAEYRTLNQAETEYWLNEFRTAFNAPDGLANALITSDNISAALSAYQRSQTFTNSRWKQYINGNKSIISRNAKRGALLFYRQKDKQGYACVNCHSGDFFTNEQFYHTLMPPVGPGKMDKTGRLISNRDPGRSLVTGDSTDRFKFRVPSLLNVEVTGPYGHNGAYTTLASVVRHMLNPYDAALNYDPQQLMQSSIQTETMRKHISEMLACDVNLEGRKYTEQEVQELVAFLLTLTDPCVKDKACLQPWIATKDDLDPMELMLMGRDENGKRM